MSEYELNIEEIRKIGNQKSIKWQVYLAAMEYIKCGYNLVPLVQGGKQLPRKDYNINYGSASRSKKIIDKWFHPETGRFAGWNIGIACGKTDGVFAIDVDTHNGIDGFANLNRLEKDNEPLPPSPKQVTPSGGMHYLFAWQPNAACTTNKIAKNIDTRGGEDKSCKGHIVVWPSIVDGKKYEWIQGGKIVDVPAWVMNRMGVLWQQTKYGKGGRGNENVQDDDYESIVPKEQIQRMLAYINIDELDYQEWLKVGMSIKSQYPDTKGLNIWDTWSSDGNRYKENECKIRWQGFSVEGSVRAGTLFYYAKRGGWEVDPIIDEIRGNKFDELVARMNEEYAIVSVGGKIRILREKEPEHSTMMHYDLLDRDSFKLLLQNQLTVVIDEKGNPKNVSVSIVWLCHEHRRTYPNGMGLYPNKTPNGYYNTWKGLSVHPRQGNCELFYQHIKNIICADNDYIYQWVLDWLADLIQFPDDPKGCCIVMRGGEGIGKGTFANAIGSLFGPHYRHLIDDDHLTSNFNAHLMDAIVVFADEITWGGNKKTSGKLKGMVTEKFLIGERKGIDALLYRNMMHMIIASNGDWVIPAGRDSRRWVVLDVAPDMANSRDYFESLEDEMDNGGKEAFVFDMISRKVTNNLRHAPETEALQDQRKMSAQQDTLINWWVMAVTRGKLDTPDEKEFDKDYDGYDDWPGFVDKVSLYNEYEEWCTKRRNNAIGFSVFTKKIRLEFGAKDTRIVIGGKRKRVFKILSVEKSMEFLSAKYKNIFE